MKFALVAAFVAIVPCAAQKASKAPEPKWIAIERDALAGIQKLWVDLAQAANEQRDAGIASRAIAAAKDAGVDEKRLAALQARSATAADSRPSATALAREKLVRKQAADRFERLAPTECDAAAEEHFEQHLWRAFDLDASSPSRLVAFQSMLRDAAARHRWDRVQRMLVRAETLDPAGFDAGRYAAVGDQLGLEDAVRIHAIAHPMQAWVALPRGWTKAKSWPVVVAVEGAGCNFLGACRAFRGARADLPFIIVTPVSFTNTNELNPAAYPYPPSVIEANKDRSARFDFDVPGLTATLAAVTARFNGERTFYMTGFSGGGFLTYYWLLHRGDDLRAAAPACANFDPALAQAVAAPKDLALPIHVFEGEKDENRRLVLGKYSPGLDEQNDSAARALSDLGMTKIERTRLPGVGHSSCPAEVMKFFESVRTRRP